MLARGDERGAPVAYRFFDESGELLAMRSDMTIPIARLVANRYADAEPPFRLCYLARAYRAVRPQRGQMREFTQAGVELVGAPAPEGTAEVVEVLAAALDAAGLDPRGDRARRRRPLPPAARRARGRRARRASALLDLPRRARPRRARGRGRRARPRTRGERETAGRAAELRGGPEVLERARGARRRRRPSAPPAASPRPSRRCARAASPTASSSTSACCATSATTPARSSRSTTRRSATCSAAAAATTS